MTSSGLSLVTGAGGFIGRRLVAMLRDRGRAVVGWTRSDCDLDEALAVMRGVGELAPATIYHLAAMKAAPEATDWTVAAREVEMLDHLASAMPDGARLIHTGTMSEYGRSGTHAEDDWRRPTSLYGFAKAAATDRAIALASTGTCDVRVARLFGVYGPGEGPARLVPHLVASLLRGEPVALRDPLQVRDLMHVDDICDRLIALADAALPPAPVVNFGTGVGVEIGRVARSVADHLGADPALLRFNALPPRAIDDPRLIADVTRLRAIGPVPTQYWAPFAGPARSYVDDLRSVIEDTARTGLAQNASRI